MDEARCSSLRSPATVLTPTSFRAGEKAHKIKARASVENVILQRSNSQSTLRTVVAGITV